MYNLLTQSECLAHAALGLGAQHLTVHGTADYTKQALHHRAGAIRLMNEQFAKPPKDGEHCDALFGAIMCLVTQTTLLPDGMTEYMILTRAGALVWAFYLPGHAGSLFHSWTHESHFAAIMSIVSDEPKDFSLVDQFHASVMKLKPLCDRKPVESYYFRHLIAAVEAIHVSSLKGMSCVNALFFFFFFFLLLLLLLLRLRLRLRLRRGKKLTLLISLGVTCQPVASALHVLQQRLPRIP
jgi:hypothetical protein